MDFKTPPLGIGYLLKALAGIEGVNPVFIDGQLEGLSADSLLKRIKPFEPLLVGFQIFSDDYPLFRDLIPRVRKLHPETVIIAGGAHASGASEQTMLENPELDYLVKGEGEEALELLVRSLLSKSLTENIGGIPNLVYRKRGKIVFNRSSFIDVEKYGAPAWEKLQPDRYPPIQHGTFHRSTRVVPIVTSRGCPYPCTFCAGHMITGKKIRRRSSGNVVDEIEFLQSRYGFDEFIIEDENFTFYKDHVLGLAREVKKRNIKCNFSFPSGIRIDRIDEEIVHALKEMGTYMVTVGLESGSPGTLKAMKKNWDLEEVRKKIRLLKRYGIIVSGNFILGFSNETMKDINASVDFALSSGIDTAYFGNYMPLPGSEDFNRLIGKGELKMGEIDWESYTSFYGRIPYHPPAITKEELLEAIRRATLRFYLRPKTLWGLLNRMRRPVFIRNVFFRVKSLFFRKR